MIHPNFKVTRSTIQGKGIIAEKKVPKGSVTWVMEHDIRIYTPDQVKKFSKQYKKLLDTYAYYINDKLVYSAGPSKYFNHSCDPNILPFPYEMEGDLAVRDILPGQEATYEYGFFLSDDESFECDCKSPKCRKVITRIKPHSKLWNELEKKAQAVYKHEFKKVKQYLALPGLGEI